MLEYRIGGISAASHACLGRNSGTMFRQSAQRRKNACCASGDRIDPVQRNSLPSGSQSQVQSANARRIRPSLGLKAFHITLRLHVQLNLIRPLGPWCQFLALLFDGLSWCHSGILSATRA